MADISTYLSLGSVEAIDEHLRRGGTDLTGHNGQAAMLACHVLAMRQIERTLTELDKQATRLQVASIVLAVVSVLLAALALVS